MTLRCGLEEARAGVLYHRVLSQLSVPQDPIPSPILHTTSKGFRINPYCFFFFFTVMFWRPEGFDFQASYLFIGQQIGFPLFGVM